MEIWRSRMSRNDIRSHSESCRPPSPLTTSGLIAGLFTRVGGARSLQGLETQILNPALRVPLVCMRIISNTSG